MFGSFRWVVALTAVLAAIFAAAGLAAGGLDTERLPGAILLFAANTLPLLAIRRNPLLVVMILGVTYPAWVALGYPTHLLQSLSAITAMYALGGWDRPLWVRALGLIVPVWMVVGGSLWLGGDPLELTYIAVFFAAVWVFGMLIADRRAYARSLEIRSRQLEEARQQLAERAVADERARIARELHDIVAHAMSVITVQAGVGAHLIDREQDRAAEALRVIERTGRDALEEMRRMLTVLRDPDSQASMPGPQPTLADLVGLVEQARRAGAEVVLTRKGMRRLPPGLELAVYRTVQEALTNVGKHAPGSRASVTVTCTSSQLEVEVANEQVQDARPPRGEPSRVGEGQGLRGMAERVELYGGQLETLVDARRFQLVATFPLEEELP